MSADLVSFVRSGGAPSLSEWDTLTTEEKAAMEKAAGELRLDMATWFYLAIYDRPKFLSLFAKEPERLLRHAHIEGLTKAAAKDLESVLGDPDGSGGGP